MGKIKEGYVLREVAGQAVVIAVGEASKNFHGMINLNCTGKDIWQGVQAGKTEEEIAQNLADEYDVSLDDAREDTHKMILKMYDAGVMED